jgi:hypothetical protein
MGPVKKPLEKRAMVSLTKEYIYIRLTGELVCTIQSTNQIKGEKGVTMFITV